jgi:hypothetical protein
MLPSGNGVPLHAERYEYGRRDPEPRTRSGRIHRSHACVVRLHRGWKFISARFGGGVDRTVDANIQMHIQQAVYDAREYGMR